MQIFSLDCVHYIDLNIILIINHIKYEGPSSIFKGTSLFLCDAAPKLCEREIIPSWPRRFKTNNFNRFPEIRSQMLRPDGEYIYTFRDY